MSIEAVLFDIGGVLELTPPTGWQERWAGDLGLEPTEFGARLDPIFLAGSTGASTLPEVEDSARAVGMHAIRFTSNSQTVRDLEELLG